MRMLLIGTTSHTFKNFSIEKVIELNPKREEAWNNKGFILCCLKKYNDSFE